MGIAIQSRCSGSAHFLNAFWGRLRPDCKYDLPVDLLSLEALENIVDRQGEGDHRDAAARIDYSALNSNWKTMEQSMRAAFLPGNRSVDLRTLPTPRPGHGEVLLRVRQRDTRLRCAPN
jgi:hypothetical protein